MGYYDEIKTISPYTLPYLTQIDELSQLEGFRNSGLEVLTILGLNDTTANPDSIRKYHSLLEGKKENLIELPTSHDVPNSNHYVLDFMIKHLA